LFISQPVIGRVSQQATIQVSKRVETNDGRFLGVLVFWLAPDNLTTLHNSVNLGERGVIALEGLDGVTRANSVEAPRTTARGSHQSPLFGAIPQRTDHLLQRPDNSHVTDRRC